MGAKAAMTTGTVLSGIVTTGWAWLAPAMTGVWVDPHYTADLPADYVQLLAAASGGHPLALFATVAGIFFLCFLVAELRWRKRWLRWLASQDADGQEGEAR